MLSITKTKWYNFDLRDDVRNIISTRLMIAMKWRFASAETWLLRFCCKRWRSLPRRTWSLITGADSREGEAAASTESSLATASTTGARIDFLLRRKPRLPLPRSEEAADTAGELSSLRVILGTSVKLRTSNTLHETHSHENPEQNCFGLQTLSKL